MVGDGHTSPRGMLLPSWDYKNKRREEARDLAKVAHSNLKTGFYKPEAYEPFPVRGV